MEHAEEEKGGEGKRKDGTDRTIGARRRGRRLLPFGLVPSRSHGSALFRRV